MTFAAFFDLVRQHSEVEAEGKRIGDLKEVDWSGIPTRWLVMATEHFAIMIHEWNKTNPDHAAEFWIDVKQRVYKVPMRRLMPMREAEDAGREAA
jgi:hypothetical protein